MTDTVQPLEDAKREKAEREQDERIEQLERKTLSVWERVFGRHGLEHQLAWGDLADEYPEGGDT